MKNKTGVATVEAFKRILNSKRKPATVQADKGTEFLNKSFQSFLKQRGIKFFTTYSEMKAAYVERFNRTLKTKMWKYFTYKNTLRYIDILPELVAAYNHSYHRSIGTTPSKVTSGNENKIWHKLYGKKVKNRLNAVKYRLQVGDQVRISKERRVFKKSYLPSWTEEIFTVAKRIPRSPPVYRLKDYDGELIEGVFYGNELQKVVKTDDVFKVEKVLKTRTRKRKKEYLVKFMGYPDKFNQWISSDDVKTI